MTQTKLPTKDSVKETPSGELDAKITHAEVTTWAQRLADKPAALAKFDTPDQQIVAIEFETSTGEKGDATMTYSDAPRDRSNLGRFLTRYGSLEPGTPIKVGYPENSMFLSILL